MSVNTTSSDMIRILQSYLETGSYNNPSESRRLAEEMLQHFEESIANGIDYKEILNSLDDSILITDNTSKVIYTNENYAVNTGIDPANLLGKTIPEIIEEGAFFKGGAVLDVIKTEKKAFRLSTVLATDPPQTGYVVGVPIFDNAGKLKQVVASSRPIFTLAALQEDFSQFMAEASSIKYKREPSTIIDESTVDEMLSTRLIGKSPAVKRVWSTIVQAAPTNATVLITGESGVGKEIIADEIYRMSSRNNKPFVKVNCASIPANLLESELFGYEKGAFSGANTQGKEGLFEAANNGTLFLDEIGDMPMDLQAKLLRAIQSQEITRVGSTKPIKLDIRFIAATNSDLKAKIVAGTFRQDLFYRLNVIPIYMPPLRDRKEDIGILCEHFTNLYNQRHGTSLKLNDIHYKVMESYSWPGNIRELENIVEYLTICGGARGDSMLDPSILYGLLDIPVVEIPERPVMNIQPNGTLSESVEQFEKNLIQSVLSNSKSLRDAGAKLGVNASTISRKIKQYGIDYK